MTDVDIIVVGAGVAGLTAARLLASAGQRALVLEALREIYGDRVLPPASVRVTRWQDAPSRRERARPAAPDRCSVGGC